MEILLAVIPLIILGPIITYYLKQKHGGTSKSQFKTMLAINLIAFFIVLCSSLVFMVTSVYAEGPAQAITSNERGMAFLAAALVTGMCTIGTGIATGQAASAALGAISENESLMGKSIIFVGLAEGVAIYGLLISFTILARV